MVCSFVPPYLLQRLAVATPPVDDACERSLLVDRSLRQRRERPISTIRPPSAASEGRRLIHTAANAETLPGTVVRREGEADTGDPAVDESYAASGAVWDLYAEAFGRQSFDDRGSTISVTVHYGSNYDNAFWDGEQLVFGDGDGQIFDRFTKPMDVLAHEFSHGFVQYTAGLTYQGQSGALNESIADVFAAMAKQRLLGQNADQGDWLIGQGLFLPGVKATALRSMLAPGTAYDDDRLGKDPQVGSMADYVDTTEDNGGVHINSGIPNRAFAVAAVGLGGRSWERAGKVWYDAMISGEVTADVDFVGFARATVSSAKRVFADDPSVATEVETAWATVGVLTDSGSSPAGPAQPAPPAVDLGSPPRVSVRRSGGFTGGVRSGELDLDADPDGPEVRSLLSGIDPGQLRAIPSAPDRFVYTLEYGELQVTLPEQALTPELTRVVQLVLGPRGPALGPE